MSDTHSFVPPVMKTFNIIVGPKIHASAHAAQSFHRNSYFISTHNNPVDLCIG